MYGERFDIPKDSEIIFISHFEGGNVFRSGVTLERGYGKIFYFQPGHESYPSYYQKEVLQVIGNAVRWAKPVFFRAMSAPMTPALDEIRSENTGPFTGIIQNVDGTAK
jgi:trehalose utilization protein